MWRWLQSLPRAVRQQCHGSGVSAGVHVDEIHEEKKSHSSKRQSSEWKTHCRQRSEWQKEESGSRPDGHDFWRLIHGPYSPLDVIRLGSLVALGINMGQFKCLHWRFRQQEGEYKPCVLSKVLLRSMQTSSTALPRAGAMAVTDKIAASSSGHRMEHDGFFATYDKADTQEPTKHPVQNDVTSQRTLHEPQVPVEQQHQSTQQKLTVDNTSKDVDSLEEAFSNFEAVCKKYTAVGKGIMGLQEADAGNMKLAIQLWTESGNLGHAKSNFNLGVCYELGIGVKRDLVEAARLYKLGAEDLHPQSMYNLGVLYMEGTKHTPRDTKKGLNLVSTAADLGLPEAQCYLGVHYSQQGSENAGKAVHYLTLAANQQHADGQYMLGMCYQHGYGVEENICKAADLYTKAAEQSHPEALYSLATFHEEGLAGLPKDAVCSERLLQQASQHGCQEAKEILSSRKTNQTIAVINKAKESLTLKVSSETETGKETSRLHMKGSVSSPCLTDLLRDHMTLLNRDTVYSPVSHASSLSQLYSQLTVPGGVCVTQSFSKVSETESLSLQEDSDSGVLFRQGSDEDVEEDFIQWETSDTFYVPQKTVWSTF